MKRYDIAHIQTYYKDLAQTTFFIYHSNLGVDARFFVY